MFYLEKLLQGHINPEERLRPRLTSPSETPRWRDGAWQHLASSEPAGAVRCWWSQRGTWFTISQPPGGGWAGREMEHSTLNIYRGLGTIWNTGHHHDHPIKQRDSFEDKMDPWGSEKSSNDPAGGNGTLGLYKLRGAEQTGKMYISQGKYIRRTEINDTHLKFGKKRMMEIKPQ